MREFVERQGERDVKTLSRL